MVLPFSVLPTCLLSPRPTNEQMFTIMLSVKNKQQHTINILSLCQSLTIYVASSKMNPMEMFFVAHIDRIP